MDLHKDFGVAILSLLVMQVAWGIFDGNNARFNAFVRSFTHSSHLKTLLMVNTSRKPLIVPAGGGPLLTTALLYCSGCDPDFSLVMAFIFRTVSELGMRLTCKDC